MLQPYGTYVCDIGGPCYSPVAHTYVILIHRNYYNAHILDMLLLEICKASNTEGGQVSAFVDALADPSPMLYIGYLEFYVKRANHLETNFSDIPFIIRMDLCL